MASKNKTTDLTVRAAFSIFQGAVLAMSLPLLYMMIPDTVKGSFTLILFLLLPALSFVISSGVNAFLQFMYCGSASASQILLASSMSPLLTFVLAGLSYMLPFLRNPVSQLFTELPQGIPNPEEALFARDLWGYSFYLFWGGVYGQTLGSGMIAACP